MGGLLLLYGSLYTILQFEAHSPLLGTALLLTPLGALMVAAHSPNRQ